MMLNSGSLTSKRPSCTWCEPPTKEPNISPEIFRSTGRVWVQKIKQHFWTYHCWRRFDSKPACLQETLVQPERTWHNLGQWVISPRRSCCWETTGACRCKGWMLGWLSFVGSFWVKKLVQSVSSPNPWIVRSPDLQPRRFSANLLAVSPPLKRPKISRLWFEMDLMKRSPWEWMKSLTCCPWNGSIFQGIILVSRCTRWLVFFSIRPPRCH